MSTQRCRLRASVAEDYAGLLSAVECEQFPAALPLAELHRQGRLRLWFDALLRRAAEGSAQVLSIEASHPGEPCVGQVSLVAISDTKHWNLSFWLHPSQWGRGLVVDAAKAALGQAYERFDIDCVVAGAAAWNVRSLRTLAKLGFEPVRSDEPALAGLAIPLASLMYLLSKAKWNSTQWCS